MAEHKCPTCGSRDVWPLGRVENPDGTDETVLECDDCHAEWGEIGGKVVR